ncbi:hypothetical protein M446_4094 [Methylobacterium sp. 4-46]|uniref:hypothetical protein n=1 Tax=unclassified Methylobacterium TaxID=2615210 RepID=UPI000165C865|nr:MULTISPECIES: hypothetical protein [Methylobacterium]ACA18452.1 hypothetical protein M446_4094 [Methylobacterium sp. 4-46]WFT77743.1 hypothetical protein QA634_20805 [Methylobacterium nodulans]
MGDLVHLRPPPDQREIVAFEAFRSALLIARGTGRLSDMRTAVEAYDAWVALSRQLECERGRR